jgi:putative membrane protein
MSNLSYTLIFIFMVLHTIGSKYTYAEVPFGFFLQELFGFTRNHYDRIVHFSFGFLFAYPVREIFLRVASTKGVWGYYFPFELTAAFSALYELMEWVTAVVVSPEAGDAFLGSQGDIWDAQKDMALATGGAVLAMIVTAYYNWRYNIRFGKELAQSVTVKDSAPLGEVRLAELEKEKEAQEKKEKADAKRASKAKKGRRST